MSRYKDNRDFMKSRFDMDIDSDQDKDLAQPPLTKTYDENSEIITLPQPDSRMLKDDSLDSILKKRRSHRKFENKIVRIEELSYLLWAAQGVHKNRGNNKATFRPVPSGGARHPFESYIAVNKVEGLRKGIYRYLPIEHEILFIKEVEDIEERLNEASLGQKFIKDASFTLIYSCIPYRTEWRYAELAHKIMLIDLGHIGQNVYMAAEGLNLGTCAIGAYHQELMDDLIELDGEDEFVVYMLPIGINKI